jgi:hypothetical protein
VSDEKPRTGAQQGVAGVSEGQPQRRPALTESEELLRLMIGGVRDFAALDERRHVRRGGTRLWSSGLLMALLSDIGMPDEDRYQLIRRVR